MNRYSPGNSIYLVILTVLLFLLSASGSFAATLYFTDYYNHTLSRMNLATNSVSTLLTGSSGSVATVSFPGIINLDTVNKKLLWVNNAEGGWPVNTTLATIMRANPDGSSIQTLASLGSIQPPSGTSGVMYGAVQPDPINGKVYWGAQNLWEIDKTKIQRANLADGSNVTDLIPNNNITTIALDVAGNKIYWTNGYNTTNTSEVKSANLDGSGITNVISNPYATNTYYGLALDLTAVPKKIYFSDYTANAVFKMNADGTGLQTVVSLGADPAYDLVLDTPNQVLYFDTATTIGKMNSNGTNSVTLYTMPFKGATTDISMAGGIAYYGFPGGAPSASAATAVQSTSFSANWSTVSGATGYLLDVSTNSGFSSFVTGYNGKNVGNVTTAPVTGLTASTPYYYRVRAYDTLDPYGGTASGTINVTTNSPNTAPAFVGASTTLSVYRNASATDITGLLHVSDTDPSQTETWSQSAAPNHGGTLSFTDATASSGSADITPGGAITYTPTPGYSGSDSFTVQVSDGTATATRTITVTIIPPPTTTVTTASLSADTGTSATDWITRTVAQTISGTLSGNLATGESVEVSYNNGTSWANATSFTVGSSSWSTTTTLSGSNTFEARVTNPAGSSTAYTHTYVLDTAAPSTTIATAAFSSDTGSSSTDFITKTAVQTISGTLSANLLSGEIVEVSLDNGSTWTTASATVGQVTWSLADQTLTASNTLKARVSDIAGNNGTAFSQAYVLDTTAPTVTSVIVPGNATYVTGGQLDFTVNCIENVIVAGADSTLGLTIGSTARQAGYLSKTATSITYRYTVQGGDIDTDGITVGALTLNTTTITDTAGNNATLTLNSVGNTTSVLVDSLIPTATSASGLAITGFNANWNVVTGATGYRLDVATDSGFTSFVTGFNNKDVGNVTSYPLTGLAASTPYHYRVRAYNADGTSGSSNTISLTTLNGKVTGIIVDANAPLKLYAGLDGEGIYRSTDGGATWLPPTTPANTRIMALAISPPDHTTLFAASYGAGVYTSSDSGDNWTQCANTDLSGAALNAVSLAIDATGRLYAGTEAGIFASTNCASWNAVNTGLTVDATKPPVALSIDPNDAAKIYAGLDGAGVFKSSDSGANWTPATTQPTNLRVKALAIKPGDSTKLFAASYGGGVFNSTDSGGTWNPCATQPTNLNAVSLTIDVSGRLYVGTEAGVFVSNDNCASWNALNTGLPL